jgi:hypothetical protein
MESTSSNKYIWFFVSPSPVLALLRTIPLLDDCPEANAVIATSLLLDRVNFDSGDGPTEKAEVGARPDTNTVTAMAARLRFVMV